MEATEEQRELLSRITQQAREDLFDEAREVLRRGLSSKPSKLVIIVGAGVSKATVGAPGWSELLLNGCKFAMKSNPLGKAEIGLIRLPLKDDPIQAANDLQRIIGPQNFATLMKDTFSPYHTNPEGVDKGLYHILSVLRDAGARIATTNYDTIIEDVLRLKPVDWTDLQIEEFFESDTSVADCMVLHIHGVYTNPANVIFGSADYDALRDVRRRQKAEVNRLELFMQYALQQCHVLFIGCNGTLSDPHFTQLFDFIKLMDLPTGRRQVLLCTDEDYVLQVATKKAPDSVSLAPYGDFASLGAAIKRLFPDEFGTENGRNDLTLLARVEALCDIYAEEFLGRILETLARMKCATIQDDYRREDNALTKAVCVCTVPSAQGWFLTSS